MRPSPEAVALAKAIPDTNDAIWKWSLKMDGSVSLESDPTPVHAAIRILAAECDALELERDDAIAEATNAVNDIIRVMYQRDALLEAATELLNQADRHGVVGIYWDNARAAIAAAKGAQQ